MPKTKSLHFSCGGASMPATKRKLHPQIHPQSRCGVFGGPAAHSRHVIFTTTVRRAAFEAAGHERMTSLTRYTRHEIQIRAYDHLPPMARLIRAALDDAHGVLETRAELRPWLDRNDERDDQTVQAERGAETPDEDHANVELRLPRRILHTDLACHAEGKASRQVAQADGQAGTKVRVAREERVLVCATLHRARDDDGDDQAEDTTHPGENDRHD
mmetsp:Transcript_45329/g.96431  ORF Transcript_45329/g.96431 Transcript_45329/m.96431 type:complete len:215 (+) Transcript_45329:276-920(+)